MNTKTTCSPQCKEALLNDLRALVSRAEELLDDTGDSDSGTETGSLGERCDKVQERLAGMYAGARQRIMAGAKTTDEAIRANPYKSLAIALGAGLLAGILLGRRSR